MSAEATGWVWNHSPYRGSELLVHLAIADVVNDLHGYELYMSTQTLAHKAKVSRSTVVSTLADMCERGLLEILIPGGESRRPTIYRFTSAVSAPARPNRASPLGQPPRANSKKPIEQGTSAISGLGERTRPPWAKAGKSWSDWNREQLKAKEAGA